MSDDDYCFMTVSDAYKVHGHAVIIDGAILQSQPHSHEQAGQHNHSLNEIVVPDLDAMIRKAAQRLESQVWRLERGQEEEG